MMNPENEKPDALPDALPDELPNKASQEAAELSSEENRPLSEISASQTQGSGKNDELDERLIVIGLGASAGGLVALRSFFAAIPGDTGMAFVVIVHLSPEYESMLAELLQGYSPMPVIQVQERVKMEPNHVYVIPPGKRLVASAEYLDLKEFDGKQGRRLQIDTFFRSLAEHHGDGAAIILSGSGSDGAVGIQQIKEHGGLILVQTPEEAEYDGMPKSAIATGLVDIIAPVEELAAQLVAAKRTKKSLELPSNPEELSAGAQQTLAQILTQLHLRTGHDFSGYKRATLLRRIARRMQLVQIASLFGYLNRLRQDGEEIEALYRDLLIHVTEFFRDPPSWRYLKEDIVPQLFAGKGEGDMVRVWTVGCATGEEAYGIAMLLLEHAATLESPPHIQIFASDLGRLVLEFAREGAYPEAIAVDVSEERLRRFFIKDNSHYRVRPEVREMILFAPHNLLQDPPFSKLDMVLCRNLLIYLQRPVQERVFDSFYYALNPNGYLFLGSAESTDGITEFFETVSKQHRVYRRSPRHASTLVLPNLAAAPRALHGELYAHALSKQQMRNNTEQHRLLLEELGLPSLLIDRNYNILHYSETVGRYLQHPVGSPTNDVTRLVRPELQVELRMALNRALAQEQAAATPPVPVRFNGAPHPVKILVRPSPNRERLLLLFTEEEPMNEAAGALQATSSQPNEREDELHTELRQTQQRLQTTREEYETTVEELRAANEELQSTNEEYRSTLEELETSKEELQSINEELQSVNQELRSRVDEVTQANSDLQNLFAATEIATLFLDRELCVKRYTPHAAELFNLMPPDRGRPIGHLRPNLAYATLEADAYRVLATLIPIEHEIQGLDGRWYLLGVRPYRTIEDKIDGVVITCVDITTNKRGVQALNEAKAYAESIVQTIPDALLVLDTNLRVQSANDAFYAIFQVRPQETEGRLVYELGNGQWSIPELRLLLEDILPENHTVTGYEVTHHFGQIGQRTMLLNGRQLDNVPLILLAITDITQRKQAEEALRVSEERLRLLVESVQDYAIITLDPAGRVTSWNEGARRIIGYTGDEITGEPVHRFYLPEDLAAGKPEQEMQMALTEGRSEDESWRVRSDGSCFWGNEIMTPLRAYDGTLLGFTKVTRDLSERRAAEEALRQSEERLRVTMQSITDYAIITHNAAGTIIGWNVGAEKMFGWNTAEAVGQPTHLIFTPEDRERGAPEQELATARERGRAEDERWHLRKEGSRLFVSGVMVPLQAGGTTGFVKVARDLTERRQWEEQLEATVAQRTAQVRELVTQLTMSEQEERRRISAILHDDLQQQLFSILFQLQSLHHMITQGELAEAAQVISEIEETLQTSVQITRDLSVDLSPPVLHNEGLVSAVRWLASQVERQYGLVVEMQVEGAIPTPHDDLRVLLFQTVRELLFNVVKHAGVKTATVSLSYDQNQIQIVVSDQGRGFDMQKINENTTQSQGLQRIEQRLQLLGGHMEITSAPGQGSRVTLFSPLQSRRREVQ